MSLSRTVLITGGTGFIGSHIVRKYLAEGHSVRALYRPQNGHGLLTDIADRIDWVEGDVLDIPALEIAFEPGPSGEPVDVIHAAAIVSFIPRDRERMERVNVEGTANVVNVCLKAGVRKLGYVSSVAAIGRPATKNHGSGPVQIDESQKWEESPNNSEYAKTKYRGELEVWRGVAEGLDAVMVCPSIVLGVGDWTRSSVQLVKYVFDEKPFYPAGLVNYVDVLDVTDALFGLMQLDTSGEADIQRRFILNGGTIPYQSLLNQLAEGLHKRPPGWRVPPTLTRLLWPLEAIRAKLAGKDPLITRETARSASSQFMYDGQPVEQVLDFQYRPLAATLSRIAAAFPSGQNGL